MSARNGSSEDLDGTEVGGGMGFEWREYYHALRERLWVVILLALIGTVLAFYQAGQTAPVYASKSTLLIEPKEDQILKVEAVRRDDINDPGAFSTVLETIVSRTMMEKLVARLKLESDFNFLPKPEGRATNSKEEAMGRARSCFRVGRRGDTRLLDITAEHEDPEVARKLADELAAEFLRFRFEIRNSANQVANQFLIEEETLLREKINRSEIALQEYRQTENAISLEPGTDVVLPRFQALSAELNAAGSKRAQLEFDLGSVNKFKDDPEKLMAIPSVASHVGVTSILASIAEKEAELGMLSQRYKPKHPKYAALKLQIEGQKEKVPSVVIAAATSLSSVYASAVQNEDRLKKEVKEQETKTYALGKLGVEYGALKREIETDKVLHDQVLSRLKETDLAKGFDQTPVKIVEAAVASYTPVRPDRQKMLLQGSLGGLMLGFCVVIGLHFLDSSIKTVDDAERTLGLPVLGAVTIGKTTAKKNPAPDLATIYQAHGPVAEAFRTLRSGLMLLGKPEDRRTFLFTSAIPAEGKTYCASNFAVTVSQQGFRTLLIDADLRKPSIGELFFGRGEKPGLSDVLIGSADLHEVILPTKVPNLFILTAGHRSPNPSELLSGEDFGHLIKEVALLFDRVVVDTAPVVAVSDTLVIVPHVSTVCLVVRAHKTPRRVVQRAHSSLQKTIRPPSCIVLNRLPVNSGGYYYYYYSGHYGKKGVYGSPK